MRHYSVCVEASPADSVAILSVTLNIHNHHSPRHSYYIGRLGIGFKKST